MIRSRILFRSALLLAGLCPIASHASDNVDVCAKMQEAYGKYSQSYHLQAILTNGQELASKTGDYTDYVFYATYVVIFWGPGQATIIKMAYPNLTTFPTSGVDQEGRTWMVNQFAGMCI